MWVTSPSGQGSRNRLAFSRGIVGRPALPASGRRFGGLGGGGCTPAAAVAGGTRGLTLLPSSLCRATHLEPLSFDPTGLANECAGGVTSSKSYRSQSKCGKDRGRPMSESSSPKGAESKRLLLEGAESLRQWASRREAETNREQALEPAVKRANQCRVPAANRKRGEMGRALRD